MIYGAPNDIKMWRILQMTKNEYDQVARIIENIFQAEEKVSPFTVAEMFRLIGNLISIDEKFKD